MHKVCKIKSKVKCRLKLYDTLLTKFHWGVSERYETTISFLTPFLFAEGNQSNIVGALVVK